MYRKELRDVANTSNQDFPHCKQAMPAKFVERPSPETF